MVEAPKPQAVTEPAPAVQNKPKIGAKKKLNKADFMFKSQKRQILVKKPGDINGIDFMIKDLEDCIVVLLDHTAQLQVDRCYGTKFFIGPIKSSIFLRNCKNCEITVSCSQFRCRDLEDSKIFLYTCNDPIVESSSNLIFAPYNFEYPYLENHAKSANLLGTFINEENQEEIKVNKWSQIFDFTEREDGQKNFQLLE